MKFEKITDTKIKIILDINDIKLHNISTNNFFNNRTVDNYRLFHFL